MHPASRIPHRRRAVASWPELDNIDFFRVEMRRSVDSIRTGAPVTVSVADAMNVALVLGIPWRIV